MTIYLKAGGALRARLQPDVDEYTRRVEVEQGKTLKEILLGIGIDPALVAFAVIDEKLRRLSHVPADGDVITLQPPVSGG